MKTIYKAAGVTIVIIAALIIIGNAIKVKDGRYSSPEAAASSYQEKVMSVAEVEQSQPTAFLSVDGQYNQNFWGTKFRVHGIIINKATVASYKDAVVRVSFLTKTGTVLGTKDYTIYEVFQSTSTTKFELKVDKYKDVAKISCEVISAVAN